MFGGGGGGPAAGGMQMPQAQLGQATMGGPQQGLGFGLGQQMMSGQPGATDYAPQGGIAGMMAALGGANPSGLDMAKLGPIMQMMQSQNQQGGQPQQMMPMMQRGGGGGGFTGTRDYLAQGGGIAPRQIINQGY